MRSEELSQSHPHPLIYRKSELSKLLGVSPIWLHREVAAGRFPAPKQLSRRSVGWLSTDVERWLSELQSAVKAAH